MLGRWEEVNSNLYLFKHSMQPPTLPLFASYGKKEVSWWLYRACCTDHETQHRLAICHSLHRPTYTYCTISCCTDPLSVISSFSFSSRWTFPYKKKKKKIAKHVLIDNILQNNSLSDKFIIKYITASQGCGKVPI